MGHSAVLNIGNIGAPACKPERNKMYTSLIVRRTARFVSALTAGVATAMAVALAPAVAAPPSADPPVATLTWPACVEAAAKDNAALRAAQDNVQAGVYSARAAHSGWWPQLSASLGYNRSNGTASGITAANANDSYSATVTGSQNLFSGFQDSAKIEQAEANLRNAEATRDGVKATVSFDLKSAYAALLFAQRSVGLQQDIIRRREENLRLVDLRFQSGRENKGSVLLSKAYLNQAHFDALQARNNIATARAQLARAMGQDEVRPYEVDDSMPVADPPHAPDFFALAQVAPAQRQTRAREEAARAAVGLARAGLLPSLSVNGTVGRQDREWFPQDDYWSVGVSLAVPLFSGGRDYYATQSAGASFTAASAARRDRAQEIVAELKQNHAAFVEAVEKLKVDESYLQAAQVRAEIARNRYNNGLISFEDWDLVENDLIARQKTVLQSRRARTLAQAAFEQTQGQGVLP